MRTVPTYRQEFSRHFVPIIQRMYADPWPARTPTAYAMHRRNLLLVSVDTFTRDTPPEIAVQREQLEWLDRLLTRANRDSSVDHVIVQGHVPVLPYAGSRVSGELNISGGADSAFWKLLTRHEVDVYLAGEVHSPSVNRAARGGPIQITHGGILGFPAADSISYLVVEVRGSGLRLTLEELAIEYPETPPRQLFQPGNPHTALVQDLHVDPDPRVLTRLTIPDEAESVAGEPSFDHPADEPRRSPPPPEPAG